MGGQVASVEEWGETGMVHGGMERQAQSAGGIVEEGMICGRDGGWQT